MSSVQLPVYVRLFIFRDVYILQRERMLRSSFDGVIFPVTLHKNLQTYLNHGNEHRQGNIIIALDVFLLNLLYIPVSEAR
jgi:hypothetical protein